MRLFIVILDCLVVSSLSLILSASIVILSNFFRVLSPSFFNTSAIFLSSEAGAFVSDVTSDALAVRMIFLKYFSDADASIICEFCNQYRISNYEALCSSCRS